MERTCTTNGGNKASLDRPVKRWSDTATDPCSNACPDDNDDDCYVFKTIYRKAYTIYFHFIQLIIINTICDKLRVSGIVVVVIVLDYFY